MYDFAVLVYQVSGDVIQLVDDRADVKKVSGVESAGVLVCGVVVVPEWALEGDRKMLAVFPMCLCLYICVDESHVDFREVLAGGPDDGVNVSPDLWFHR
jgi:hypothetical protein